MREFIIDKAPGKELIPNIIETESFNNLNEFYKIRVDWYGYPLIHDRFVTFGLFNDLINEIPNDRIIISKFIDFSIIIAECETDERFLNAIFFILNFCQLSKEKINPTAQQISRILALKERVQKRSFLSNMSTFWEQILECLSKEPTFNKNDFIVKDDDYKLFIDTNFPCIDNNTDISSPIEKSDIIKQIEGIKGEYEPIKFVRSAHIDKVKYWVWLYKNIMGNVWNWYITVRQDEKGFTTLKKYSMHGSITKTPEKLLLDYHYFLNE